MGNKGEMEGKIKIFRGKLWYKIPQFVLYLKKKEEQEYFWETFTSVCRTTDSSSSSSSASGTLQPEKEENQSQIIYT